MRRAAVLLVPGLATFSAWWATLGWIGNWVAAWVAYIAILLAIGVATGRRVRDWEVFWACVSAWTGISAACWVDWSEDPTGLFVIGWFGVTVAAAAGSLLVIGLTAGIGEASRDSVAKT